MINQAVNGFRRLIPATVLGSSVDQKAMAMAMALVSMTLQCNECKERQQLVESMSGKGI
jgi:hypothetical protein